MKIYSFTYCPDIHDSAPRTIITHKTKIGAYKAMKAHKEECYQGWYEERITYGKYFEKFGWYESWSIKEGDLLD